MLCKIHSNEKGEWPHQNCVKRFLSPQCEQRSHTHTQQADERVNRKTKGSFFFERCQLQRNQLFYAKRRRRKKKRSDCFTVRLAQHNTFAIRPAGVICFSTPQFLIFLSKKQCFCQEAAAVVPHVINGPLCKCAHFNPEHFAFAGRPEYMAVRRNHKFSSWPLEGTVNNVKR